MTAPSSPGDDGRLRVHATFVAWPAGGVPADEVPALGVLLRGPSGSGKSDLALRLLDRGWRLVADDQCLLSRDGDGVRVEGPETLRGKLEVRGLGIVSIPAPRVGGLRLLVDLVPPDAVERLPGPATESVLGIALPRISLAPFEVSAPVKLALAAGLGPGTIMPPA